MSGSSRSSSRSSDITASEVESLCASELQVYLKPYFEAAYALDRSTLYRDVIEFASRFLMEVNKTDLFSDQLTREGMTEVLKVSLNRLRDVDIKPDPNIDRAKSLEERFNKAFIEIVSFELQDKYLFPKKLDVEEKLELASAIECVVLQESFQKSVRDAIEDGEKSRQARIQSIEGTVQRVFGTPNHDHALSREEKSDLKELRQFCDEGSKQAEERIKEIGKKCGKRFQRAEVSMKKAEAELLAIKAKLIYSGYYTISTEKVEHVFSWETILKICQTGKDKQWNNPEDIIKRANPHANMDDVKIILENAAQILKKMPARSMVKDLTSDEIAVLMKAREMAMIFAVHFTNYNNKYPGSYDTITSMQNTLTEILPYLQERQRRLASGQSVGGSNEEAGDLLTEAKGKEREIKDQISEMKQAIEESESNSPRSRSDRRDASKGKMVDSSGEKLMADVVAMQAAVDRYNDLRKLNQQMIESIEQREMRMRIPVQVPSATFEKDARNSKRLARKESERRKQGLVSGGSLLRRILSSDRGLPVIPTNRENPASAALVSSGHRSSSSKKSMSASSSLSSSSRSALAGQRVDPAGRSGTSSADDSSEANEFKENRRKRRHRRKRTSRKVTSVKNGEGMNQNSYSDMTFSIFSRHVLSNEAVKEDPSKAPAKKDLEEGYQRWKNSKK